jgi:hypothetical protein
LFSLFPSAAIRISETTILEKDTGDRSFLAQSDIR